jgi:HSP20 family protein
MNEEVNNMKLIRWNPAFDLINVHSELDRVFNELVGGAAFNPQYAGDGAAPTFLPIDIRRDGENVVVQASVPGFKPQEVSVTFDGGVLTIATRHADEQETGGQYLRRERRVGRFYRQISLGEQVDGDRAQATFDNGVLTVTIPLVNRPEPRQIPINGTPQS